MVAQETSNNDLRSLTIISMKTHFHPALREFLVALFVTMSLLVALNPTQGQSIWDGGSATTSNWSDATNWQLDALPLSDITTDVQMAGGVRTTVNVDSAISLRTLIFNSGASSFTLSGNLISVQGAANADTPAVANNSTATQTINNSFKLLGGTGFNATNGSMVLNGNIDMNGKSARFVAGGGQTLTLAGVVSGTAGTTAFNSSPTGTVVLANANTFSTGTLYLWGGNVKVNVNGGLGAASSVSLGVNGSAAKTTALLANGAVTITQSANLLAPSSGVASYTLGGSSADSSTFSGRVYVDGNTASGVAQAVTLTAASGGRVTFTDNVTRGASSTGTGDVVTKTGAGIVVLSGAANNYAGNTVVTAGTLLVNGTLSATSGSGGSVGNVSVASGAVLGGAGVINRAVSVSDGGTLAAGDINAAGVNLGGKLIVGSDLTLSNMTVVNFDLAVASSTVDDQISVGGNFTLDGVLNVTSLTGFGEGTYTLFDYSGTLTNNGMTLNNLPGGFNYALDFSTANQVNLIVTVPEPATMVLLLMGGCLMLCCHRERRCFRD